MHRIILLTWTLLFLFTSSLWSMVIDEDGSTSDSESQLMFNSEQKLFTPADIETMFQDGTEKIVQQLLTHKIIKFERRSDVILFASIVKHSGYEFAELEPRIVRLVKKGERIFTALDKAIDRETFHRWHVDIVNTVAKNSDDDFVTKIRSLALTDEEQRRMINVYATCIVAYTDEQTRASLQPDICIGGDDYPAPRHVRHPVALRSAHRLRNSVHHVAYQSLLNKAKIVVENHQLDTFERIMMAKCISEQSLRFFNAQNNPLKALRKHRQVAKKAPEEAFFMRTGVCSNFSFVTEDVVTHLGLSDKVFLAKRPAKLSIQFAKGRPHLMKRTPHVYLEFVEDGTWYHTHPFSGKTAFPIQQFKNRPVEEDCSPVNLDEVK